MNFDNLTDFQLINPKVKAPVYETNNYYSKIRVVFY